MVKLEEKKQKQLEKLVNEKIIPALVENKYGEITIGIKNGNIVFTRVTETDNNF